MGTRGSFPGGNAAGKWSWPLTSRQCRDQGYVDLYIHSTIRLHGVVLNQLSTGTTLTLIIYHWQNSPFWALNLPQKILPDLSVSGYVSWIRPSVFTSSALRSTTNDRVAQLYTSFMSPLTTRRATRDAIIIIIIIICVFAYLLALICFSSSVYL
jgi:hypothetical protein